MLSKLRLHYFSRCYFGWTGKKYTNSVIDNCTGMDISSEKAFAKITVHFDNLSAQTKQDINKKAC
jgi:hypothetical protein